MKARANLASVLRRGDRSRDTNRNKRNVDFGNISARLGGISGPMLEGVRPHRSVNLEHREANFELSLRIRGEESDEQSERSLKVPFTLDDF